ncbi:MAG: hypothetical protein ACREJM_02295, partial [Candidatus Saccharimonadales bacterium]
MASKKTRTCLICKTPFKGRSDAKTCSPACRKRLQRNLQSLAAEKSRRLESAVGKEFHRLAAALLKQHVLHEPLVLADERGAIPVAEPPVTVAPERVVPASASAPAPAVTPDPTPAAEPAPVVSADPAVVPTPSATDAVSAAEAAPSGEAIATDTATPPAGTPVETVSEVADTTQGSLPAAESLETVPADGAYASADAGTSFTEPAQAGAAAPSDTVTGAQAIHLEDVMSTESLEPTAPGAAEVAEPLDSNEPPAETRARPGRFSLFRYNKMALMATSFALLLLAVISAGGFFLLSNQNKPGSSPNSPASYAVGNLPLGNVRSGQSL